MTIRPGLLQRAAQRRAFERSQKELERTMPEFRDEFLRRLQGRASPDKIEAVAKLAGGDRAWFDEVERILGFALAGDIFGEMASTPP